MKTRIAFIARQAGSAAAFIPLIQELSAQNSHIYLTLFALEQAAPIWLNAGLNPHLVINFADAQKDLIAANPQILITGTSFAAAEDCQFWRWARQAGIPALAFIDHWTNYPQRFSSAPDAPFDCVADWLAVIDHRMYQGLCAAGAPKARIIILGHPGWDQLSEWRGRSNPRLKKQLAGERILILFISEPIADFYGASWGYSEIDALFLLRNALAALDRQYTIVVKPHPRQNLQSIVLPDDIIDSVQIRISTADKIELLTAADVITGINSMLLHEATLIGRPVISLRPGQIASISDLPGWIIATNLQHAISALMRVMSGEITAPPGPQPALPRWINWLQSLLKSDEADINGK